MLTLLLPIFLCVQDKDPIRLKWKIPKDHFVRYKAFTFNPSTPDTLTANTMRVAGLFAYEIHDDTRYTPAPRDDRDIPLSLCFTLPSRALAVGQTIDLSAEFEKFTYGPITVKGSTTRNKNADNCVELVHKAKLVPGKSASTMKIEDGTFDAVVHFDPELGVAKKVRFSWAYTYELQTQPKPSKYTSAQHEVLEYVAVLPPRYKEFQMEVDKAIDKGIEAIWKQFNEKDGHWPEMGDHKTGQTALSLLAIMKGNYDRRDPRLRQALDWLLKQPLEQTYDVGISLMALEAWYTPKDPDPKEVLKGVEKAHLAWAAAAAKWLLSEQNAKGMWHYPMKNFAGSGDYSNTQYGVLGLLAASRLGAPVDLGALVRSMRGYLESQQKTGPKVSLTRTEQNPGKGGTKAAEPAEARGWAYGETPGDNPYGSMTLGGIGSLTILEFILKRAGKGDRNDLAKAAMARRDGWAWMQSNWTVKSNANYGWSWYCYYLYAMERAAMLGGVATVGGHDWYFEGAVILVSNQMEAGTWFGSTLYDTCFCVLFLKRATTNVATPTK